MVSRTPITDAWHLLKNPGNLGELQVADSWNAVRLGVQTNGREVLAAIDGENGRHLLVPALKQRYPLAPPSALSVEVAHQSFRFFDGTAESGRFLDIFCSDQRLYEQFDHVIMAVLEAIRGGGDGADVALIEVARWRRLFATLARLSPLSVEEKVGLFAELTVLDALNNGMEGFDPSWWTGPLRQPHDFELPSLSIEVKAITDGSDQVRINGLRQLDSVDGKDLNLILASVMFSHEGFTIGELLEQIVSGDPQEQSLRELAAKAGIYGTSDDTDRMIITGLYHAEVEETFPRITPAVLGTEAISRVNYSIDLGAVLAHAMAIQPADLVGFIDE
ncbi:PD-(D/E)XK motif protein [Corynebacterium sp. CNCTC7651]|uniref:PD-(D/E)XK motif protein n=1 Tax=Corynebacterium sp. CNCTC7651 TaxID=2815361 RepID=UPI001F22B2BC|nr:PD-(D/E)XK motif protein [Corynebacterium sp. CNCTC7651]UIZ92918.1 PD-(D/E)XK motif protein [Corynebacterium sp. CNCTC7651]